MSVVQKLRSGRGLSAYAWCVVSVMVLVILWGAFVRISGSGNGCGDHWPLCNNEILPHHPTLKTIIEFLHRMQSGLVTTMVIGLIAWIFLAFPAGHRARRAVVWTGGLLVTEALLGAALVLGHFTDRDTRNARVIMQSVHFTNTMLLLAALTLAAWFVSRTDSPVEHPYRSHKRLAVWSILLTIAAGASGSVAALADTLFPSPSLRAGLLDDFAAAAPLIVRMRWVHPAVTAVEFMVVAALCLRMRTRLATLVAALLGMQVLLGVTDVLLLAPGWMQVVHLLGADIFWIALVILCSEAVIPAQRTTAATF